MDIPYLESVLGDVKPGAHAAAQRAFDEDFTAEQKRIAILWSHEWYVSRAGVITVGNSPYQFFLIKPTINYQETLGIAKELVVIISNYNNFDARILDAYDEVAKQINQESRIEKICYVLISKFDNICNSIREFSTSKESQVIIPFSYGEFARRTFSDYTIRNKFRDYFYSRDLFDYSDPLKKDFYFFGRSDIVMEIISRHRENQNSGVFGLRKTGKTSIIYDVLRKLSGDDSIGVFIDCQNPSFNVRRWNQALAYTIRLVENAAGVSVEDYNEENFTVYDASDLFSKYIKEIHEKTNKRILLLFDEIENISFEKSPSAHWRDDLDFIHFWEAIRSAFYHSSGRAFTYSIFGTNARCIEVPTMLGADNPIFNAFTPRYIPGFMVDQTREMVRTLGRLMGMKFDTEVFTHLNEDYGGHPFLIRRVCSQLAKMYPRRPVLIDRAKYRNGREQFNKENDYFSMLLDVLKQFYPDEYEMLLLLAKEDLEDFQYYAKEDRSYVKHLLGYGIISEVDGVFDFKIDSIKDYLLSKLSITKVAATPQEKWKTVCAARNDVEQKLRRITRDIIRISHAPASKAKEYVVAKIYGGNKGKYSTYSYEDLFDSKKSEIFLKSLKTLMCSDWAVFSDYFGSQDLFCRAMDVLNAEGRFDAHASIPDEADMGVIDSSIKYLDKGITKYYDAHRAD